MGNNASGEGPEGGVLMEDGTIRTGKLTRATAKAMRSAADAAVAAAAADGEAEEAALTKSGKAKTNKNKDKVALPAVAASTSTTTGGKDEAAGETSKKRKATKSVSESATAEVIEDAPVLSSSNQEELPLSNVSDASAREKVKKATKELKNPAKVNAVEILNTITSTEVIVNASEPSTSFAAIPVAEEGADVPGMVHDYDVDSERPSKKVKSSRDGEGGKASRKRSKPKFKTIGVFRTKEDYCGLLSGHTYSNKYSCFRKTVHQCVLHDGIDGSCDHQYRIIETRDDEGKPVYDLQERGEHTGKVKESISRGIHPVMKNLVDDMLRNGASPTEILNALRNKYEDDAEMLKLLPDKVKIVSRKITVIENAKKRDLSNRVQGIEDHLAQAKSLVGTHLIHGEFGNGLVKDVLIEEDKSLRLLTYFTGDAPATEIAKNAKLVKLSLPEVENCINAQTIHATV